MPSTQRRLATYRIDEDLLDGLDEIFKKEGVTPAEQVRRAIRAWLEKKGVVPRTAVKGSRPRRQL